jgi:hypothetical protein
MAIVHSRMAAAWFALGALVLSGIVSTAARAQAPAVETAATTLYLRAMAAFPLAAGTDAARVFAIDKST